MEISGNIQAVAGRIHICMLIAMEQKVAHQAALGMSLKEVHGLILPSYLEAQHAKKDLMMKWIPILALEYCASFNHSILDRLINLQAF